MAPQGLGTQDGGVLAQESPSGGGGGGVAPCSSYTQEQSPRAVLPISTPHPSALPGCLHLGAALGVHFNQISPGQAGTVGRDRRENHPLYPAPL